MQLHSCLFRTQAVFFSNAGGAPPLAGGLFHVLGHALFQPRFSVMAGGAFLDKPCACLTAVRQSTIWLASSSSVPNLHGGGDLALSCQDNSVFAMHSAVQMASTTALTGRAHAACPRRPTPLVTWRMSGPHWPPIAASPPFPPPHPQPLLPHPTCRQPRNRRSGPNAAHHSAPPQLQSS